MLTLTQRELITATVPILEVGGEALVRHFYLTLFNDYPQVVPLFNESNQRDGAQQRALAMAILRYARNIDRLEALGPMVATIVNKHVSLQIQPEHYPYVGAALLKSIRQVLGPEVATDAIIEAWGVAYGQLADLLIGLEREKYRTQEQAEGGWSGTRPFEVVSKQKESAEITSFVLRPIDGGSLMDFLPGQYISICVDIEGREHKRQYSLSAASNRKTYRISVKRESHGLVSNHLHDWVEPGTVISLIAPAGAFTLKPGIRPVVLISGGVGITPTLPMLDAVLDDKRPVHFIHAARNTAVHGFRDHVDDLAAKHPQLQRFYCHDNYDGTGFTPDAVGFVNKDLLKKWLPSVDVDVYLLGPTGFMRSVLRSLRELGVPESQVQYEFFGPAEDLQ